MGKGTGGVVDVVLGRRYTGILGFLIPHPLWKDIPIFFFLFYIGLTCKILSLTLESFFLLSFSNFCSKYGNFFPTCIFFSPFFLVFSLCGLSPKGGSLLLSTPVCVTFPTVTLP